MVMERKSTHADGAALLRDGPGAIATGDGLGERKREGLVEGDVARNALTDMLKREIEDVARRSAELLVHEAGIHLEEVGLEQPRKRRERPQCMTARIVSRRELARARDGVDAAGKLVDHTRLERSKPPLNTSAEARGRWGAGEDGRCDSKQGRHRDQRS